MVLITAVLVFAVLGTVFDRVIGFRHTGWRSHAHDVVAMASGAVIGALASL